MNAETIIKLKILPRFMMLASTVMSWRCAEWFMGLDSPTASQSAFVSVVMGVMTGVLVFGWDTNIRLIIMAPKKRSKDPKVGTGKKPKGSGRRLYTDENPKDTVSIKFATPADARATVAKVKKINKPYARKIQILTVMEQRAKVMKKAEVVRIAKSAKESLKRNRKK